MAWGIWAIIGLLLLVIETLTVDFTFVMLAGGAFAAAIGASITDNLAIQVVIFAVVAAALLLLVRPWLRRRSAQSSPDSQNNVYAMEGKIGVTISTVDSSGGRVKVNGEVWSAKAYGPAIAPDTRIVVQTVEGAAVVVAPITISN